MAAANLLNKFRGSMMGGLVGDCLGSPYEGETAVYFTRVNLYFAQLFNPKVRVPYKPYTDDTVMSKAIAESLVENKGLNAPELARRFTTDYFAEPKRGYGAAVHDVFMGLRNSGFEDPFYPARKLFGGQGSFGNGAAMRIAPIALFAHKEIPKLLDITDQVSRITHSHNLGIRGAILQSLAVRQGLLLDSKNTNFDEVDFLDSLIKELDEIESKDAGDEFSKFDDGAADEFRRTYVKKLKIVKEYLKKPTIPPIDDIHKDLGVHASAINSVPTAIYCVLLARNPIPGIECDNQFQRCIQFAISLGGDTDTIASMAASISGAHLGLDAIPKELLRHCETPEKILKTADDLYTVSAK